MHGKFIGVGQEFNLLANNTNMKIVICLPVSRYKTDSWLLPASVPMDNPKDCAGIRSLHELAVAVAATGREIELRGEFDMAVLTSLSEAAGAMPTVHLEPRLPTADDLVIILEGTPSMLDAACASLSPAQYILFMLDPPGLLGWAFESGLTMPDPLVVSTSSIDTVDSFKNISECGFSVWTNSSRLASACIEAGVACTDIGIGYSLPAAASAQTGDTIIPEITGMTNNTSRDRHRFLEKLVYRHSIRRSPRFR